MCSLTITTYLPSHILKKSHTASPLPRLLQCGNTSCCTKTDKSVKEVTSGVVNKSSYITSIKFLL